MASAKSQASSLRSLTSGQPPLGSTYAFQQEQNTPSFREEPIQTKEAYKGGRGLGFKQQRQNYLDQDEDSGQQQGGMYFSGQEKPTMMSTYPQNLSATSNSSSYSRAGDIESSESNDLLYIQGQSQNVSAISDSASLRSDDILPNTFRFSEQGYSPLSFQKAQENIKRPTQRLQTGLITKDELHRELSNPQQDDFICDLPFIRQQPGALNEPFQTFNYVHGLEEFGKLDTSPPISNSPRGY